MDLFLVWELGVACEPPPPAAPGWDGAAEATLWSQSARSAWPQKQATSAGVLERCGD
jgi:hypothetical protein